MAFAPIKASAKGGRDFEPVPAGIHIGVCTQVIDLGFQQGKAGPGYEAKVQRKVYLRWEIPDIEMTYIKDGVEQKGPACIGREFTLSLSDKAHLLPFIENWRGKSLTDEEREGFDISSLAGKICQLQVMHEPKNGKTYANVTAAFLLTELQKQYLRDNPAKQKPKGELQVYSTDAPDDAIYKKLPEWLRKKIDGKVADPNTKIAAGPAQLPADDDFDDDIPF